MTLLHWNYFLALEDDLETLARYIEFHKDNLKTYSIETARILMLATQEVDVLLKQLCKKQGDSSSNEAGYRQFFRKKYPQLLGIEIRIPRYGLSTMPFSDWNSDQTLDWWTANNKIKHKRDTHFSDATLENTIHSLLALLLVNIYYYIEVENTSQLFPNPKFLDPFPLVESITPTRIGNLSNYILPK